MMRQSGVDTSGLEGVRVSCGFEAKDQLNADGRKLRFECHQLLDVLLLCICFLLVGSPLVAQSSLTISGISDNSGSGGIPKYEKLEIEFQVLNTVAENLQLPYDGAPPAGIAPGIGITVNALFTPDNWQTTYIQPAFYYQVFEDEIRGNREWFYPTDQYVWKVRFAPHRSGSWQYRISAQDASGTAESNSFSFQVTESSNPGFIRVSSADPRYFEFEDGTYFPGLGYNMNYDHVSWRNPVRDNEANFETMAANGIQLIRIWLSQWAVYGSEWNPWNSQNPTEHGTYLPATGIGFGEVYPGSDVSMQVNANIRQCMFIGLWKAPPAVKRNTSYRVRIRYKTKNMGSPVSTSQPYGFVAKTGGWLWSNVESERCYSPGTGTVVTPYQNLDTADFEILEGSLNSGNSDFLPNFFLVMENIDEGQAFIDYVWIEEDLGGGLYGPNIVPKPWMAHHLYFEQRNSYAFDKVLELARDHGIYLRPVVLEKNDRIFGRIDYDGNPVSQSSNDYFYGDWRSVTKVRWLHQAWWRYLQARWGYSTQIHSWELLNEGNPNSGRHHVMADEFGKYMHAFTPNDHLVSTSNWHSFPNTSLWANEDYPDVDFADVHLYIPRDTSYSVSTGGGSIQVGSAADYDDTALATRSLSEIVGALGSQGAGKPVIRGETGFVVTGSEPADPELLSDQAGIWLHNFIWGGINAGGLIESYWYENYHIYDRPGDDSDLRSLFRNYYDFVKDIPLNNGNYEDVAAGSSSGTLRAWGQKDINNQRAHLWIQNKDRTWRNSSPPPASGSITVPGLNPNTSFAVEWWDTGSGTPTQVESLSTNGSGVLTLDVANLATDIAVKISSEAGRPAAPRNLRPASGP